MMNTEISMRTKAILFLAVAVGVIGYGSWLLLHKRDHVRYDDFKVDLLVNKENIVPVLVLGSGPAGLSAALYGARSGFHTVLFDGPKPGGQLMGTSYVENWPGLPKKLGPDLIKSLKEQATEFGALMVPQVIKSIDLTQWPYVAVTETGVKIHALTVVIATGASSRLLGVPGEQEYLSWDKGISTCAICDAPFYKGKEVFVVGGGDSAAEEAMQLAPYAKKITLLVRKGSMRASAVMQERLKTYSNIVVQYNSAITAVKGDEKHLKDVEMQVNGEKKTVTTDGIFLAVGHDPNSEVVKGAVAMDPEDFIIVKGRSQATSVPGVYAAGDVADRKYRQAGIASGDGIKAALDAVEFLRMIGFNDAVADKLESKLFDTEGGPGRVALEALLTMADYDKVMTQAKVPVFLDFYTEMCPTCMQMLPTLEMLSAELSGKMKFYKVDLMKMPELGKKYQVEGVPTFIVLKDGAIAARAQKTMSLEDMRAFLAKVVG